MTTAEIVASNASSLSTAASRSAGRSAGSAPSRCAARAAAFDFTTGPVNDRGQISTATGAVAGASNGQIA